MGGFEEYVFRQVRDSCVDEHLKRVSDHGVQKNQNDQKMLESLDEHLKVCSDCINELKSIRDDFIQFVAEYKKQVDEIGSGYKKQVNGIGSEYKNQLNGIVSEYKKQVDEIGSEYKNQLNGVASEYEKRLNRIVEYDNQLEKYEESVRRLIDQYNEEQSRLQKTSLLCSLAALC